MRTGTLVRPKQGTFDDKDGMQSAFTSDKGLKQVWGELPWRNNDPNISCCPCMVVRFVWKWSEEHKTNLYHAVNVPLRSEEEIHGGNLSGDVAQGRASQVLGCFLPGTGVGKFPKGSAMYCEKTTDHKFSQQPIDFDQVGVTDSHTALVRLHHEYNENGSQVPFELTITEA